MFKWPLITLNQLILIDNVICNQLMFTKHQSYLVIVEPPAQEIKILKKKKKTTTLIFFPFNVSILVTQ